MVRVDFLAVEVAGFFAAVVVDFFADDAVAFFALGAGFFLVVVAEALDEEESTCARMRSGVTHKKSAEATTRTGTETLRNESYLVLEIGSHN